MPDSLDGVKDDPIKTGLTVEDCSTLKMKNREEEPDLGVPLEYGERF